MAVYFDASSKYVQVGAVPLPNSDWTLVHLGTISGAGTEAYNNLISNANPGNASATHYVSFLYTAAYKPAVNVKGASLKLDSGELNHVLPTDKGVLTVLRRTGNLMQYWSGVVDSVNGNTPIAKIWEADCTGIGAINVGDLYLYRRDGAYTSYTAGGNFYSFGFAASAISESQMNSILSGSSLASIGVTWTQAYEEEATTGTATVFQDLSANDKDATVFGSPSYVANFSFPAPAAPVGLNYPFNASYRVGATINVAPTFTTNGTPSPTFAVTAGSLPAGLTLNAGSGVVSGSPTTLGSASFSITATNSQGSSVDASSFTIAAANAGLRCPQALKYWNGSAFVAWASQTGVPYAIYDADPTSASSNVVHSGTLSTNASGIWPDIDTDAVGSVGDDVFMVIFDEPRGAILPLTVIDLDA